MTLGRDFLDLIDGNKVVLGRSLDGPFLSRDAYKQYLVLFLLISVGLALKGTALSKDLDIAWFVGILSVFFFSIPLPVDVKG